MILVWWDFVNEEANDVVDVVFCCQQHSKNLVRIPSNFLSKPLSVVSEVRIENRPRS
jgi:hypothetical protein